MEQAGGFSNKRFNSWIGLGLLAVALPLQAQPALSPAPELAQNLVKLAQNDEFMDMRQMAAALQLPHLPEKVIWHGPAGLAEKTTFFAVYDPPSANPVSKVVFTWAPGHRTGAMGSPPQMFTNVRIVFDKRHCPAVAPVAAASQQKPTAVSVPPSPHVQNGRPYTFYSFKFPAPHGQSDAYLHVEPDRCEITLNKVRDL